MRRIKRILLPLLTGLVLAGGISGVVAAQSHVTISGTADNTVYKIGQSLQISGTVNGDVICAAQTVTIDAQVNGDVICAAQTITINGDVTGSARLAGQTVIINGKIGKSASLAAQDLTIAKNSSVGTDIGIVAQSALINGTVGRDIKGVTRQLTLGAAVGRNVDTRVSNLFLANGSDIKGSVLYTSTNNAEREAGAQVQGMITREQPKQGRTMRHGSPVAAWLAVNLVWLGIIAVSSLALVLLVPQMLRRWNKSAHNQPWKALLIGVLASFVGPAIFTILLLTAIGVPLAFFYLLISIVLGCLSLPVAAFYLGERIYPTGGNAILTMLIGVLVLWIIGLIPVLGFIVQAFAFWLGLGILLQNLWRLYEKPRYVTANKS